MSTQDNPQEIKKILENAEILKEMEDEKKEESGERFDIGDNIDDTLDYQDAVKNKGKFSILGKIGSFFK